MLKCLFLNKFKMRLLHFIFNAKNIYTLQNRFVSCWSCGSDIRNLKFNLFCDHCSALQKPLGRNSYFKTLNVAEKYDLNENELHQKYKELQKYLHPDKFVNRNKTEQEISAEYSSIVNEAYKTLLEPLSRGVYMLKLKGKELPENTDMDKDFLLEIMEKNEEVENADTQEEIIKLKEENNKLLRDLQSKVSKAFFHGDLDSVVKLLCQMKYYKSIDNQIQNMISKKGIIQ